MSEMINNKISEEQLNKVAGGNDGMGEGTFSAYDISPRWVRVTASELNCRGSTIRRAASAAATFTKTIQSWINTLKTYIIDVS